MRVASRRWSLLEANPTVAKHNDGPQAATPPMASSIQAIK